MAAAGSLTPHEALILDGLAEQWGTLYRLRYADGAFTADRWDDAPPLTAGTLPGLAKALRSDFYRRITR